MHCPSHGCSFLRNPSLHNVHSTHGINIPYLLSECLTQVTNKKKMNVGTIVFFYENTNLLQQQVFTNNIHFTQIKIVQFSSPDLRYHFYRYGAFELIIYLQAKCI